MVDMAHFAGLVAGKVFTGDFDPIPHAHIVTTTTHKTLRSPRDGAWYTSGIRLGTPALTTRGLNQADMDRIAHLIHTVLASTQPATTPDGKASPAKYTLDAKVRDQVSEEAADLMTGYPLHPAIHLG